MKMPIIVLLILLPPAPASAGPRDWEGSPRGRICNMAPVNNCIQRHAEARARLQTLVNSNAPIVEEASRRVQEISNEISLLEADRNSLRIESQMIERELDFLGEAVAQPALVIDGQVSLENYFGLTTLERDWQERYPAERSGMLSKVLAKTRESEKRIQESIDRQLPDLQAANSRYKSAQTQNNKWLAEAHEHDGMCNGGCKIQHCPTQD